MFDGLAEAVEGLDIPVHAEALVEVLGLADRLAAKVTMAVGAFDAAGGWDLDGDTSMTAWLRHHGAMTGRNATVLSRTARRLRNAPVTAGAWSDGALTGGQVAAIFAHVSDTTAALWEEHEADVVPTLVPLPVVDVAAAMGVWRARAEAITDPAPPGEPERTFRCSRTLDGRGEVSGSLDAEAADIVATALRVGTSDDVEGEQPRSPGRKRADALVDICRAFLDHQTTRAGGRHRPHVNLLVDWDARVAGDPAAGSTADGVTLSPGVISRSLCDCGIHRVVTTGGSTILDYGRRTQTIPAPLFNALVVRDTHCRWPGCDRPPTWCEGHHVVHWEHGGATRPDNLVLLCSRHHHRAHQPGWHVKLLPDATVEITGPDRTHHTSRPPPRC